MEERNLRKEWKKLILNKKEEAKNGTTTINIKSC